MWISIAMHLLMVRWLATFMHLGQMAELSEILYGMEVGTIAQYTASAEFSVCSYFEFVMSNVFSWRVSAALRWTNIVRRWTASLTRWTPVTAVNSRLCLSDRWRTGNDIRRARQQWRLDVADKHSSSRRQNWSSSLVNRRKITFAGRTRWGRQVVVYSASSLMSYISLIALLLILRYSFYNFVFNLLNI